MPDAEGTGTVLLTAAEPALLQPGFGDASAPRHAAQRQAARPRPARGCAGTSTSRASLRAAVALGVGPRTAAALAGRPERSVSPGAMQGSVHRFDAGSGAGSVLLDDGTEVPFDGGGVRRQRAAAAAASVSD